MALVFIDYILWHFTVAPENILRILSSYIKATHQRFLITTHLRTLFSPWHRSDPSKVGKKPSDPFEIVLSFLADVYIRILAAVVRLAVIIVGLFWEGMLFIGFMLLFVAWLLWPVISLFLLYRGLILLF